MTKTNKKNTDRKKYSQQNSSSSKIQELPLNNSKHRSSSNNAVSPPSGDDDGNGSTKISLTTEQTGMVLVVALSVVLVGVLSHYEIEGTGDLLLANKTVALSKSRAGVFQVLSKMETQARWVPGIASFDAIDTSPIGIGKHYTQTYSVTLYGDVISRSVITGYESPNYICYVTDNWLQTRTEWTFTKRPSSDIPTALTYTVYSRKKTVLYTHFLGYFASFFYSQNIRQALFNLRFMFQESFKF